MSDHAYVYVYIALYFMFVILFKCTPRHRRVQEVNNLCTDNVEPNTVLWAFHTIQPSSLRLNDPFCCGHHSRDYHCFTMGRPSPKLQFSVGDLDSRLTHASLGPQESASKRHLDWPYLHSTSV